MKSKLTEAQWGQVLNLRKDDKLAYPEISKKVKELYGINIGHNPIRVHCIEAGIETPRKYKTKKAQVKKPARKMARKPSRKIEKKLSKTIKVKARFYGGGKTTELIVAEIKNLIAELEGAHTKQLLDIRAELVRAVGKNRKG